MQFTVTDQGDGIAVVHIAGRLNMVTAPRLREVVAASVAAGQNRVAVDLSDVDFIDSSGLGALIGGLKTARQAGGDLRIAAPNEQVRLVLQLTNMERVLTAYPAASDAFHG
ncbi:anti-sigma factor antagonist [Cryobacterium suzukii]|uniref:Anti-sigma factor antagonist n=1 Tax=Cryobacterium suzukii TaxID=1259198 RepID=A0A4R9AI32_9MICO|nr:STAS domain-containing protein [Cryobacterium suzukii]TFD61517.1 anti-sigma factor antagonist [Cryobacterium suzukii]